MENDISSGRGVTAFFVPQRQHHVIVVIRERGEFHLCPKPIRSDQTRLGGQFRVRPNEPDQMASSNSSVKSESGQA